MSQERVPVFSDEAIARVCHEVNRVYCRTMADNSQVEWSEAPDWQKQSAINGVAAHRMSNCTITPRGLHSQWLGEKREQGWSYGSIKDVAMKQHPCFLPYDDLPFHQKMKDEFFGAVCRAMLMT